MLTPLIVANSMYFPFITGKAFYFRIIVELMVGAWVILALYEPRVRPQVSAVSAAVLALLGVALVASLLGVNPSDSIWSNFERMMGWITLLHVAGLFYVLGHTLRAKHWRWLLYFSIGVSVLVGFLAFGEVGDVGRVDGPLGNAIYLAVYAMFHAMLAGYFILRAVRQRLVRSVRWWASWQFYVFGAVAAINLLALYYTKTRGAILGLLAGLGLAALLVAIFEKKRPWLKRSAIGLLALAVILGGSFLLARDSDFVQNQPVLDRFADISLEEGTAGARLDIWALGLEGYTKSSKTQLIGYGPGNFNYVFNENYNPELFEQETWFDRAHNVALEWLVAAGPLGLLAYLALFGAAIYLIWRDPEEGQVDRFSIPEKSLLTGLVVAYLLQNLFVFDHLVSYLVLTLLLAWLHTRSLASPEHGWLASFRGWFTREEERLSPAAKAWTSTGVVLGVVALAVVWNYPGMAQNTTLIDALRQEGEAPEQALGTYQRAINYDSWGKSLGLDIKTAMGTQEARERLTQSAIGLARSDQATSSLAQKYFVASSQEMEAQIADEPKDLRHRVFYGQLLLAYNEPEAAREQFARANEMSGGRKQVVLFQLAQSQTAAGDQAAALASYRQAYELDKDFSEPALRYAAAAIAAGEPATVTSVLNEQFGTTTVDSDILIQAYLEAENYQPVVSIFKKRLQQNANDPQAYANLAALQAQAGLTAAAIDTLERATARFPQIEGQASEMIRRIRSGNPVRP
jgi:O-antigen ligase/thioredoxin-like negative regulator of GroEL